MKNISIVDTGPIVAFVNQKDKHHEWVKQILEDVRPPLLTCESVISEACFLLRKLERGEQVIFELLARGLIQISFSLQDQIKQIDKLMRRYNNVPMSLADACLVRMTELHGSSKLITLDSDFEVYRKENRQTIPIVAPF